MSCDIKEKCPLFNDERNYVGKVILGFDETYCNNPSVCEDERIESCPVYALQLQIYLEFITETLKTIDPHRKKLEEKLDSLIEILKNKEDSS